MEEIDIVYDPCEFIGAAYYAMEAVNGIDTYDHDEQRMISEIRKMALTIIYENLSIIHLIEADQSNP